MDNKQNAKLNMSQRVADALAANADVYTGITPVVEAAAELNAIIDNIREVAKEQIAADVAVAGKEKRAAEGMMIDLAVRAANALYVIGFTTNNKELTNLSGLSPNSFYRVEDNAKLTLAERVYNLAQSQAAALSAYGYDSAKIDAIGAAVAAYRSIITKPMDTLTVRKQKTTNLKELFAALDSVLYDKWDKLIVLFKESHPNFYGEYRTARNFINTALLHKKAAAENENTV
ncbi:MAG: hypothetical protein LBB62_02825 [Proteiniphilum sp.]|jgi:hypothetical protein|nr:hypothetical protein [Proteiniphilum sp.]